MSKEKILMQQNEIDEKLNDAAEKICRDITDFDNFAIIGIHTRGVVLAERIRTMAEKISGREIKHGTLDISCYRDDLGIRGRLPVLKETLIEFNINGKMILLVDDVLFTGRTTKAALETLTTFGRPEAIRLFVLVDRGGRELPIQADYCGCKIETDYDDLVKVILAESDDGAEDSVLLIKE